MRMKVLQTTHQLAELLRKCYCYLRSHWQTCGLAANRCNNRGSWKEGDIPLQPATFLCSILRKTSAFTYFAEVIHRTFACTKTKKCFDICSSNFRPFWVLATHHSLCQDAHRTSPQESQDSPQKLIELSLGTVLQEQKNILFILRRHGDSVETMLRNSV